MRQKIDITKTVMTEGKISIAEMQKRLTIAKRAVNPTVQRLMDDMVNFPKEDVKDIKCATEEGAKSLYWRIHGYIKVRQLPFGVSKGGSTVYIYHEQPEA